MDRMSLCVSWVVVVGRGFADECTETYSSSQLSAQGRVESVIGDEINKEGLCCQFCVYVLS